MTNAEIAAILYEIADYLEAQAIAFKPRAYREAAQFIEDSKQQLATLYRKGGVRALEKLPEVGPSMAKKIGELIETGKLRYYEKLKRKLPVRMAELTAIEGVGPKMVRALYQKLRIKTVHDLEKAARAHRIQKIPGFREKTEVNMLRAITALKAQRGRMPYRIAKPIVDAIIHKLRKLKEVQKIEAAGSLRRKAATIGDIDIVAASKNPKKVMDSFASLPDVERVYSKGGTKTLLRLKRGIDADLRVVPPESYGAALQYFTGDKAHSIATRKLARKKGMKLNEYGLFKGKKRIAGRTEEEIYEALGLPFLPPEKRSGMKVE